MGNRLTEKTLNLVYNYAQDITQGRKIVLLTPKQDVGSSTSSATQAPCRLIYLSSDVPLLGKINTIFFFNLKTQGGRKYLSQKSEPRPEGGMKFIISSALSLWSNLPSWKWMDHHGYWHSNAEKVQKQRRYQTVQWMQKSPSEHT